LEKVATAALSLLLLPLILVKLTQQLPKYNFNLVTETPFAYMVGNSFQHFLTNELQNRLLQSVRSLLTDNGIFVFDTRFPTSDELLQASFWFVNHIFVSLFNRLYTIRNKKESMIFTHAGTFIIQYNRGGTVR